MLRLLAKRNSDIVSQRIRVVCRLHALFQERAPGGIAKKMNAFDAQAFLARLEPANLTEQTRYDLATELYEELCGIESTQGFGETHRRSGQGVGDSGDRTLWSWTNHRRSADRLQR